MSWPTLPIIQLTGGELPISATVADGTYTSEVVETANPTQDAISGVRFTHPGFTPGGRQQQWENTGPTAIQTYTNRSVWKIGGGDGTDYEIMASHSGDPLSGPDSDSTGAWLPLTTNVQWALRIDETVINNFTATLTIQIRNANTMVVLDTGTVTLNCIRSP